MSVSEPPGDEPLYAGLGCRKTVAEIVLLLHSMAKRKASFAQINGVKIVNNKQEVR